MNYTNLTEFIEALDRLKTNLPNLVVPYVRQSGEVLANLVRNRVSTKGVDNSGASFSPYSAKHKLKRKRLGHAPLGTQGTMKNFYMTGSMWNTFGIRKVSVQGLMLLSTIDFIGKNAYLDNKELAEIHSDNEGVGITDITQKEEDTFVEDLANGIVEIIKANI